MSCLSNISFDMVTCSVTHLQYGHSNREHLTLFLHFFFSTTKALMMYSVSCIAFCKCKNIKYSCEKDEPAFYSH